MTQQLLSLEQTDTPLGQMPALSHERRFIKTGGW